MGVRGGPLMTSSDIGPLKASRRGISIGTFLLWIILSGIGGGIAWGVYGNEVRSRLGVLPEAMLPSSAPVPTTSGTPVNDETVALLKDLQASQKNTADQLETALQLLISAQATSKAAADSMAALSAKIDRLQRPAVTVAKKAAPAALLKPPAIAPVGVTPVPAEPEPEPSEAPTSLRR
jgi:hypothetical protein